MVAPFEFASDEDANEFERSVDRAMRIIDAELTELCGDPNDEVVIVDNQLGTWRVIFGPDINSAEWWFPAWLVTDDPDDEARYVYTMLEIDTWRAEGLYVAAEARGARGRMAVMMAVMMDSSPSPSRYPDWYGRARLSEVPDCEDGDIVPLYEYEWE